MLNREHAFTTLYNLFLSLTDEPICFFSSKTFLCSYILIGNRVRVKSSGMARGLANARPLGSTKFANAPAPGTDKAGKCPAVAWGGWAQVELTDA